MVIIKDLWKKLEWIEGLLGYAFERAHFADGTIQIALKLPTNSQWSRKKGSKKKDAEHPISPWELGRLFEHFELPATSLNHAVFTLPYDEFQEALKRSGVGIHGIGDEHRIRQILLSDSRCERGGIVCRHVKKRGGFSLKEEDSRERPQPFRIGDRATIRITIRENGYLLLLNDQVPIGETTCLVPSVFAPQNVVRAGSFLVPYSEDIPAVDVEGPPGWYRLFAIWTRTPLRLPMATKDDGVQAPRPVTPGEFSSLQSLLREKADAKESYAILTTEYQVIDRL